jgi:YD repeat-containing protein
LQAVDLQIGNSSFPNGLTLSRSYNSASGDVFSGFLARGWSHNWFMQIRQAPIPRDYFNTGLADPCDESFAREICIQQTTEFYTVVALGNGSAKFTNGQAGNETGRNIPGEYLPMEAQNLAQKLEFIAAPDSNNQHADGHYEFTDSDGTHYVFNSGNQLQYIVAPNGVTAQIGRWFIKSSNGYALIFERSNDSGPSTPINKACIVNLAKDYVDEGMDCPQGALFVSYGYDQVTVSYPDLPLRPAYNVQVRQLTSVSNAAQEITRYEYDDGQHINCIKDPGRSECRISITYGKCVYDYDLRNVSQLPSELPEIHLSEPVLMQRLGTGEKFDYYYHDFSASGIDLCPAPPDIGGVSGYKDTQGSDTELKMELFRPKSIKDTLGRITSQTYWNAASTPQILGVTGAGLLASQTLPEGNRIEVDYNDRGLVVERRIIPKPGSGEPVLVTSSAYPTDCTPTTRKTCNKPVSQTDAKGNVTNYEYSDDHGGVMRVLGSAVDGIRPETRYSYVQKYAWLKAANGNYEQADAPFWVLAEERSCTNSAMNANGDCANGADLVVTQYEYQEGNASKGSNVWLLGTAVTATNNSGQSETLRSCYTYDNYGRKVSESQPKANLASCN